MKKLMFLILALSLAIGVSAFAQDTMKAPDDKMAPSAPLKNIKGTVKAEGDKITFVSDKDNKSWDVMNPETLKEHVGHHVQLSVHVDMEKNSVHVMSVKMLKMEKMDKMDHMGK
jgi:hypothetical protein